MSEAYRSVVHLSLSVRAGLLIRQTHHWAANVFIAAIVLHLFRIFFTGAYRKPRELTYWLGLTMLTLALLEAYLGYSLVDDLMSGMGLAIGYSVGLSIPFVGENLMNWLFGGMFPGSEQLWPRMYIAHVLIFPVLIGLLLGVHLLLVAMRHHTYSSTNGAQPDWYLGWLIGGLRLVPSFDLVIAGYTLVPNPFWGGAALPLLVFGFLYLWPWLERRFTGDQAFHNLLDRPRDAPVRTGIGIGVISWVVLIFFAGSSDRVDVTFGLGYIPQIWFYRVAIWVLPPLFGLLAWWICKELQAGEAVVADRHKAEAEARLAHAPGEELRSSPGG